MSIQPKHGTEAVMKLLKAREDYFFSLGAFVHIFATLETTLFWTVVALSNVKPPVARAVYSGLRVDQAMSFSKRLLTAQNASKTMKADFEFAFTQLSLINQARNDILHFGADLDMDVPEPFNDEFIATNEYLALTENHVRRLPVSAKMLEHMTDDLGTIRIILTAQQIRLLLKRRKDLKSAKNRQIASEMMSNARKDAWQYKPAPQAQNHSTRSDKPPKQ